MTNDELKLDPRVVALAECVVFAINNFKNKPVVGNDDKTTTWHKWFKDSLKGAGYVVTGVEDAK